MCVRYTLRYAKRGKADLSAKTEAKPADALAGFGEA